MDDYQCKRRPMKLFMAAGLMFFCVLFMQPGAARATEVWKITSLDWQPYAGQDMKEQGSAINELRQKLSREGIVLDISFLPWARAKRTARNDSYVGYFPAWPEEVDAGFEASPPIAYSSLAAIAKEPVALEDNLETLFQKEKVGLVLTYVYPDKIKNLAEKYAGNVTLVQDEATLATMLYHDKFQVAFTDPEVFTYHASQKGMNKPVVSHVIEKKALVLAVKKNDAGQRQIEILKKALRSN